jgi:hypothetical protein
MPTYAGAPITVDDFLADIAAQTARIDGILSGFTSFVPSFRTQTSPLITTGSTRSGYYKQIGKLVHVEAYVIFGSGTVWADTDPLKACNLQLPVSAFDGGRAYKPIGGTVVAYDNSAAHRVIGWPTIGVETDHVLAIGADDNYISGASFAWDPDDFLYFNLTYQAA